MHVGHIEIFVRDLHVARDFYVRMLGCQELHPQVEHVCWLGLGDLVLLLRPGEPRVGVERYGDAATGLVLYADGLDAKTAELEARGLVFHGNDGSARCPTFSDPDGNWFQLVDPSEQSAQEEQ